MKILQTKNLQHRYSSEIGFQYPDLHCGESDELLIIGNSGHGKSTLMHLIALILPIQNGEININGHNISSFSSNKAGLFRARNIGLILQQHYFIKSLSVMDNLLLANYYAKSPLDKLYAKRLTGQLEIESLLQRKIFELSGGELQRVGIARALMNKPNLLLADEPTSNLDDDNCERVHNLIKETSKASKAALIIVTHDQRLKTKIQHQINL